MFVGRKVRMRLSKRLDLFGNEVFAALNLPRLSSIAYILFVCIGAVLLVVFRLQKRVSDALE